MSVTVVAVGDDAVAFAKNSDAKPGETDVVEHVERTRRDGVDIHEIVASRDMGANEHTLAIGAAEVFTRVPIETSKHAPHGTCLARDALERCKDADDALDRITSRLAREGQGGAHHAFVIADPQRAWLLETAGRFWAACWIRHGIRTASNALSIGADFTKVGAGTIEGARSLGLVRRGETFDFRRAFAAPMKSWLSAANRRRASVRDALAAGEAGVVDLANALRDHRGACLHAPSCQTSGSMISILRAGHARHFFTATSAPCISVFKPVPLGRGRVDLDGLALFSAHERLHRAVLASYDRRRASFEGDRVGFETKVLAEEAPAASRASEVFAEHREHITQWTDRALASGPPLPSLSAAWWRLKRTRPFTTAR